MRGRCAVLIRRLFLLCSLVAGLGLAGPARPAAAADADGPLETAVKAAFLYKFQLYVQWPAEAFASPASTFNFCVVGETPFARVLDRVLQGQVIGSHPAVAVRLAGVAATSPCQVLYVAAGDAAFARAQLDLVAGRPVLTVTDGMDDGARGMINFVLMENHVRFEIDNEAAMRNGLALSSKLLHIAVSVHQRGEATQ